MLAVLLITWLACGFFCSYIAVTKGRDKTGWFLLGLLFPLLSLIALIAVPARETRTSLGSTEIYGFEHVARDLGPLGQTPMLAKMTVGRLLIVGAVVIALVMVGRQFNTSAPPTLQTRSVGALLPAAVRPATLDGAAQQQGFADFADMTRAQAAGYRSAVEWHGHLLANQQNPATAPVLPAKKKAKAAAHAAPGTPRLASDH
jgi:hypothetical protein